MAYGANRNLMLRSRQRGFITSLFFAAALASLTVILSMWLEVEKRKIFAKQYKSIVNSQEHLFKGLDQYFQIACSKNGIVPPTSVAKLTSTGFIDEGMNYNPHNYNYIITIRRPTVSFEANSNRAIADGRTLFSIVAQVPDAKQRSELVYNYRKTNLEYSVSGNAVTVSRHYIAAEGNDADSMLYDGMIVGNNGGSFVCI
ncbi:MULTISPECIES: hypothetical protein [Vibrio]|uniref:Uncharacterized protein n=1 Tax=Vibrio tasmaniensis TaxID=212663 RepID=A0A2N7NNE3_9VIBR|nr:hypothetical protein [Vibrio tasmaniensis]PMO80311.1 hypothetical protein BCT01_08450 [Vibrio tasmaniensis]PMP17821.1 hypothetical protein BCS92_05280 [Vibrio tasmaniensis]TKG29026.1 hypothetical protein FC057_20280 [Vibrio tasmaniensis]TKG41575.1 hypothetical protein FC063_06870 [Vibrio tasmaniensis]TKG46224.1 hypothetical protein FC070_22335 [Vibrio tasmaniensis]